MKLTIATSTIRQYATEAEAEVIARAANADEEDDWTYKVVPSGERFAVAIYDEDDEFVGCLG